jgi:cystathionine gamma-synthase
VMGNLEGWLGVRSLRTLELRVVRQSESAGRLVAFLNDAVQGRDGSEEGKAVKGAVKSVEHASLQEEDMGWLREQMPNGFGPVFAMHLKSGEFAKRLPSKLDLFHHATSLGGVESLIEWRRMSDDTVADTLVRVSVGIESWEDLKRDIVEGCKALVAESEAK